MRRKTRGPLSYQQLSQKTRNGQHQLRCKWGKRWLHRSQCVLVIHAVPGRFFKSSYDAIVFQHSSFRLRSLVTDEFVSTILRPFGQHNTLKRVKMWVVSPRTFTKYALRGVAHYERSLHLGGAFTHKSLRCPLPESPYYDTFASPLTKQSEDLCPQNTISGTPSR